MTLGYNECIKQIHAHINLTENANRLIADINKWNIICGSLDVLGQTVVAIEYSKDMDLPSNIGGQFLQVTGLLQTLFVQQDVVSDMNEVLLGDKIDWEKYHPELKEIRNLRNSLVGHPTNRGKGDKLECSHLCFQTSKDNVEYVMYNKHDTSFKHVDLGNIVKIQASTILDILNGIVCQINKQEHEFIEKFRGQKMINIWKNSEYLKEKLRTEQSSYIETYVVPNIEENIKITKEELDKRYYSWEMCSAFCEIIKNIDDCIKMIKSDYSLLPENLQDSVLKNYADYLCYKLDDLCEHLRNVDEYFLGHTPT